MSRPESHVFREMRLLYCVPIRDPAPFSEVGIRAEAAKRGSMVFERKEGNLGTHIQWAPWVGAESTAEENLLLKYRWCLRNGWFIRNRQSVTNLFSAVLSFSFLFLPCPLALGAGLLLTPHPDTPTSRSACSPSLRPSSSSPAGSPTNNWVSMATWKQLKNGN